MQKLTQFAGSRQILRGYGKNTDGHQALEGLRLRATFSTALSTCIENQLKASLVAAPSLLQLWLQRQAQEGAARNEGSDTEPETRGF